MSDKDSRENDNSVAINSTASRSRQPDRPEMDLFTSVGRLLDEHVGAAFHSFFGIPTALQARPHGWIDRDRDYQRRSDASNERHTASARIEEGHAPSSSSSHIEASKYSPDHDYDRFPQAVSQAIRAFEEQMRAPVSECMSHPDPDHKGQPEEWIPRHKREPYGDLFGGRLFSSFFDEFFSDKPFGANQRREEYREKTEPYTGRNNNPWTKQEIQALQARDAQNVDVAKGNPMTLYVPKGDKLYRVTSTSHEPGSISHLDCPVSRIEEINRSESDPSTELDLHDFYRTFYNPSLNTPSNPAQPFVVSSMSSTSSYTGIDGLTRTKHVCERRYSDGSVEREENDNEQPVNQSSLVPPRLIRYEEEAATEGWEGWGEYGYPTGLGRKKEQLRRAFAEERKAAAENARQEEPNDKKKPGSGWFWASPSK